MRSQAFPCEYRWASIAWIYTRNPAPLAQILVVFHLTTVQLSATSELTKNHPTTIWSVAMKLNTIFTMLVSLELHDVILQKETLLPYAPIHWSLFPVFFIKFYLQNFFFVWFHFPNICSEEVSIRKRHDVISNAKVNMAEDIWSPCQSVLLISSRRRNLLFFTQIHRDDSIGLLRLRLYSIWTSFSVIFSYCSERCWASDRLDREVRAVCDFFVLPFFFYLRKSVMESKFVVSILITETSVLSSLQS